MDNFVLTCCSTADMSQDFFDRRRIPYVCFHYTMDGVEYPDDLGLSMPFDEFYRRIAAGSAPTTSQVTTGAFLEFFEPLLREGRDVLHISLSSGLSGSFNSACIARDELLERYPQRKLIVVDSLGASSGYGLLVDTLADMRDAGASIDETAAWAEDNKLRVHHWFFSTDLTSYRRGGRISGTAAVVGTILNICPLLNMDKLGHLTPRRSVRTKKKVIEMIVRMMETHADGGTAYDGRCFMSNSACLEDAEKVRDMIEERIPAIKGKVIINSVGTTIGAHTGPGTVALFFMGDSRATEKGAMC